MASQTIVLITGANSGIGLETVKALLRSDRTYHILLAGRDINKAKDAAKSTSDIQSNSTIDTVQLDVEDDGSISSAAQHVSSVYGRIDCLVNNAGGQFDQHIKDGRMTVREAWTKTFNVNVAGQQIVTEAFLPLLLKSEDPRLLFITSGLSSLQISSDPNHPRYIVPNAGLPKDAAVSSYKSSKAGLNMMMTDWTRLLKNDGVKVFSVAPGFLATNFAGSAEAMKKAGAGDVSLGGIAIRKVIEGERDADTGKVVRNYDSPVQPW